MAKFEVINGRWVPVELRDKQLNLRFKQSEIDLIDTLVKKRTTTRYDKQSRSDVIIAAVKFALGDGFEHPVLNETS